MAMNLEQLGPVHLLMVELDSDKQRGQVASAIRAASTQGTIRILDALAIRKEAADTVLTVGTSDLSDREREAYGVMVAGLLGLRTGGPMGSETRAQEVATTYAAHHFGLSMADIRAIAHDIPVGKTVLTVLFEHRWALPIKEAIQSAGGELIAQTMVSPETFVQLGSELSAAGTSEPLAQDTWFKPTPNR
jgi:hypothetical protein